MLQPMKDEPPLSAKCKDKFLIQSTIITPEKETKDLQDIVRTRHSPSRLRTNPFLSSGAQPTALGRSGKCTSKNYVSCTSHQKDRSMRKTKATFRKAHLPSRKQTLDTGYDILVVQCHSILII